MSLIVSFSFRIADADVVADADDVVVADFAAFLLLLLLTSVFEHHDHRRLWVRKRKDIQIDTRLFRSYINHCLTIVSV